jgi:hypothetical protein
LVEPSEIRRKPCRNGIKALTGRIEMDQETKNYLDQRLFVMVKKEDLEKLRQEVKANYRQLREETKTQLLEGFEEIKAGLERTPREEKEERDSFRTEVRERLEKLSIETRPLLEQWNQGLVSSLDRLREAVQSMFAHSKLEMNRNLQMIQEEQAKQRTFSKEEWKVEIDRMWKGVEEVREQMKRVADEASVLRDKIKEEFTEIKEELASMMKFSFSDLDKKMLALEARIKALEKMVFH